MTRAFALISTLVAAPALAAPPSNPPLPPPRPRLEAALPPAPKADEAPPARAGSCAPLESGRVVGVALPPIPGANGCGVPSPVRVSGVRLADGAVLKITPEAVLNCDMAGELATFLDEEAARMAQAGDGKIVEVLQAGAYECRATNRIPGAKISEHAGGNAIDLRAFKFADGRTIVVGSDKTQAWNGLKGAACARFKTVLGPGSDAEHKDHLHLDMRLRKSTTICQWVLD